MHHRGPLLKWTNLMNGWQYRFCVLQMDVGILSYYLTKGNATGGNRKGCVRLKNAIVGIDDDVNVSKQFTITDEDGKTFYFEAQSVDSKNQWVKLLQNTIAQHSVLNLQRDMNTLKMGGDAAMTSTQTHVKSRRRTKEEKAEQLRKLEDRFDKNMREADQFFQMIEKTRAELVREAEKQTDPLAHKKLEAYLQQSEVFIHAINNAIINLQISKKNVLTEESINTETLVPFSDMASSLRNLEDCSVHQNGMNSNGLANSEHARIKRVSESSDVLELHSAFIGGAANHSMVMPTCSYSSGEESSDEFFDADMGFPLESEDEDQFHVISAPHQCPTTSGSCEMVGKRSQPGVNLQREGQMCGGDSSEALNSCLIEPQRSCELQASGEASQLTTTINLKDFERNGTIDCDDLFNKLRNIPAESSPVDAMTASEQKEKALDVSVSNSESASLDKSRVVVYDEDQEEDELDMDTLPRSIITHLLSQIKIGFDLTTITLPIQILERRSLLEMFADFCANPHYVCKIDECKTPKDRFIMLLKWYFSAFKTGRKPISKKPYNPIIGELFQCYYTLPSKQPAEGGQENGDGASGEEAEDDPGIELDKVPEDGPVPWAGCDDVAFIAEQVSHHPPISCFYAESPTYGFQMTGHVWTKSKFLGLSIAVDMVGEAIIKLLNHNESYRVTFPSAYGRNILAVPWTELGGLCVLEGLDTGYRAEIEFRTRGGIKFTSIERDLVRVRVFEDRQGTKQQIGTIQGLWTGVLNCNFNNSGEVLFVDTNVMKPSKKRVRPLTEQKPNESRNQWRFVTKHLREKNIEEAQKEKKVLEDKQRAEEGARKRANEKFKPVHFEVYKTVNGLDHYKFKGDLTARLEKLKSSAKGDVKNQESVKQT